MSTAISTAPPLLYRPPTNDGWVRIDPWPVCTASWRRDEAWQWEPYPAARFDLRRLVRSVEARRQMVEQWPLFASAAHDAECAAWEAQRAFVDTIPPSVRRAVMAFRDQHLFLLRIAATGPFAEELLAPDVRGHPALAYGVAMHLGRRDADTPAEAIAELVSQPRQVIAERLGWSLAPAGVRFLTRVAPGDLSPSVLRAALSLVNGRKRPPQLRARTPLTPILLSILTHPVLGPKVTPWFALEVSGEALRFRAQLRRQLLALVDREAGGDRARYPMVCPFESFRQLQDRARVLREQETTTDVVVSSFPPPPLRLDAGPLQLWPITTPQALTEEGEIMAHCVANFARDIGIRRTHYAYRLITPERATVLVAWRRRRWVLVEARRADNVAVSWQTRATIRSMIARAQQVAAHG